MAEFYDYEKDDIVQKLITELGEWRRDKCEHIVIISQTDLYGREIKYWHCTLGREDVGADTCGNCPYFVKAVKI